MVWCLTSTETTRIIRDGEMGKGGVMEVEDEGDVVFPYGALCGLFGWNCALRVSRISHLG